MGINPNRRSSHYKKQSKFENSDRQIRSTLLFIITQEGIQKESTLIEKSSFPQEGFFMPLNHYNKMDLFTILLKREKSITEFLKLHNDKLV